MSSGRNVHFSAAVVCTTNSDHRSEPIVTKVYREDVVEPNGGHGEEYRYWDYTFDFVERAYRVRIYTDEPDHANVFRKDLDEFPLADPSEQEYLRAIRSCLEVDGWGLLDLRVLARAGDGYVSVPLD
jgi:hypothetical protein